MSPGIGDRVSLYCHWHHVMLSHPQTMNTLLEFERWNAGWSGCCSIENHHPLVEVWEATQGKAPVRSEAEWCGSLTCKYFPIDSPQVKAKVQQLRSATEGGRLQRGGGGPEWDTQNE